MKSQVLSLSGLIAFTLLGIVPAIAQADLESGLVVHYPFDGNADDASGNGYHATVFGVELTEDRFGQVNSAYLLDGQDYIQSSFGAGVSYPNGITIQAWVKSMETYDGGLVISRGNSSGGASAEYLGISSGLANGIPEMNLYMKNPNNYGYANFTSSINDAKWHHVLGTYDGSKVSIYVDGVGVNKPASLSIYSADNFKIGWDDWRSDESGRYFTGVIDDVRIWDRALNPSEIQSLVPEPATTTLLAFASLMMTRHRKD